MKFRKKLAVIEAHKWLGHPLQYPIPDWLEKEFRDDYISYVEDSVDETLAIKTLEGDLMVSLDDYIIKGIKGELYPCKPDIFEMTYDQVVD